MQKIEIDELGLSSTGLTIIGGRPAMGKTSFMLSIALNMAMHGNPVAIFLLEMSEKQLFIRLLSNICYLPLGEIRYKDVLSDSEIAQISDAMEKLQGLPLFIDDTLSLSVTELRAKAERLVREHGVKMIAIDYLQLMSDGENSTPRDSDITKITHSLKELSKELDISVIASLLLCSKNEDTTCEVWRPALSDVRKIGFIEKDAETICLIHRPEYYVSHQPDNDGDDIRGKAELIYAKCPNGTGIVDMLFRKEYLRFEILNRKKQ